MSKKNLAPKTTIQDMNEAELAAVSGGVKVNVDWSKEKRIGRAIRNGVRSAGRGLTNARNNVRNRVTSWTARQWNDAK
jgi:hypothetical protein